LVWIAGCWNSLLTRCNPKNNCCLPHFWCKVRSLCTYNLAAQNLKSFQILKTKIKKSRPIQRYHSHADPIWPDGTFKCNIPGTALNKCLFYPVKFCSFQQSSDIQNSKTKVLTFITFVLNLLTIHCTVKGSI
jgi:hypothetical protein